MMSPTISVFNTIRARANLNVSDMPVVKCPNCGRETEFTGNEFRPFCSERCKLLDFGAWADEEFALPTERSELTEQDIEQIERASNGGEK